MAATSSCRTVPAAFNRGARQTADTSPRAGASPAPPSGDTTEIQRFSPLALPPASAMWTWRIVRGAPQVVVSAVRPPGTGGCPGGQRLTACRSKPLGGESLKTAPSNAKARPPRLAIVGPVRTRASTSGPRAGRRGRARIPPRASGPMRTRCVLAHAGEEVGIGEKLARLLLDVDVIERVVDLLGGFVLGEGLVTDVPRRVLDGLPVCLHTAEGRAVTGVRPRSLAHGVATRVLHAPAASDDRAG